MTTKAQLLSTISNTSGVIVGQHIGGGPGDWPWAYNTYMNGLSAMTGKFPGCLSADMAYCDWESDPAWFDCALAHHSAGGIIMYCWHTPNPVTGGGATDLTPVDLTKLITPGEALNTTWKGMMDVLVARFLQLKAAGIPIVFRPFHEMNGAWHWYEDKNQAEFIAMWIYTKTYFDNAGCDNVLWCYCPNRYFPGIKSVLYYNPGVAHYDLVGIDHYGDTFSELPANGYNDLIALGKPLIIAEYGPNDGNSPPANFTFDYSIILGFLAAYVPQAKLISSWSGGYSPLYQNGAAVYYAGMVTRDKIAAPTAPSGLTATTISRTQINLSWVDNSSDEVGFKIERSLNGTSWAQIATVGAGITTYNDTGLTCGTTYYYRVCAYN